MFLYHRNHPEDGHMTGRNTLLAIIQKITCIILTLNLLKTTIVAPPSNASKWQMGFNSAFKGLKCICWYLIHFMHVSNTRNMKRIEMCVHADAGTLGYSFYTDA